MNFITRSIAFIALATCAATTLARDDIQEYSIAEALSTEQAKNILGTSVKFYFGNQPHGAIVKKYGEFGTNKKTNGVGKSDKQACEWAFLSAMKSLRERAEREGANAVVNIRSNYRNATTSSTDTFKCGSGAIMSGVALLGDVVELK
ncbi:YbjQ family protein [Cellvibrio japonicus]|uniref:Excinuclease ATPase subunit n=1 Tax=Cellvibrio japonicus (strain Ueda107) TaxID=498211 RepID=B3PFH8_CELJU|nr:excinuclease ABC subunit A [Cellvibrio japonicus]ACE82735.1 Excinuclease ATPase subunit [Cellvibrio japonicus Ueda107]QEI10846.1 excinuclease ABC subunit A [Cellvibrio japonicus]QEI14422.1 excinuclease ABC subunit A [Cellvibrio japonicus]QEI18000.1 excinuclease ABC subunit A [Cellvibrio japonicus]